MSPGCELVEERSVKRRRFRRSDFSGFTDGIYSASKFDRFPAIVNKTADVVAREFGTCLKLLSIFTPTEDESMWACFEVNQGRVIRKYQSAVALGVFDANSSK